MVKFVHPILQIVRGRIVAGYGVASGEGNDPRYPEGSLRMQAKYFKAQGIDLSLYFNGTLNVDISPYTFNIGISRYFVKDVHWSEYIPPENFYFFDVSLLLESQTFSGLIYLPDPVTKHDHHQKKSILELLLPKIKGLQYGDDVQLLVDKNQLDITHSSMNG